MAVTQPNIIEFKNIVMDFTTGNSGFFSKQYMRALNDVSFSLQKGRARALVGESGSGKSTCARIISKIHKPKTGDVLWNNESILGNQSKDERRSFKRKVQMIFQDPFGSLNPTHSIAYHLKRPLLLHNEIKDKSELNHRVIELLETVGLTPAEETAKRFPHELSGGQRQRVAIARVLAINPEVILADEPTSMLDVSIRIGVLNLMEDLKQKNNIAFLYITHDIATARYFAEDTSVMYAGHIVEWGASEEITKNPQHPYTQLLIESVPDPKKSFISQKRTSKKSEIPLWRPQSSGCPFYLRCKQSKTICKKKMPDPVKLSGDHFTRCFLFN